MTAKGIIDRLVRVGIVKQEFCKEATEELHRELSRRSRRVAQDLAMMASSHQFAMKIAQMSI